ncbi:hypothetical protein M8C13_05410 [Crossiella sp. SN42]|uniref:hypothetical protein n=1 Tax=Crossiella sp. SN42 TaxID=2944808 RepID=UPI00207CBBC5|nr:hypothetical protein [Crossiella sp. SN42]MCO1575196.1 hypothetical protein [Crossiella sp. SN42]
MIPATPPPVPDIPPSPDRHYGSRCRATAALTLTELTTLIMADLIMVSVTDDPDMAFPARIRYAATVSPRDRVITLWVFGLTNHEVDHPYIRPQDAPCPADFPEIIETVSDAYNWHGRHSQDRRFELVVVLHCEREQRKQAWTVGTVSTDGRPRRSLT